LRDVIRLEVLSHLRRMVRRNRTGWPTTRITFRVDGHYARPEAMTRREDNGSDYIFGLPGTKPLTRKIEEAADIIRTARASFFWARSRPCRQDRANGLHCFCQRARSPCLSK
jgi:Transposase DDE domain group 1